MNHDLLITTDPALIANLHVRELAEQGKESTPEKVIEKWQSVPNRCFIVSGTDGFVAFQEDSADSCYLSDLYVEPQCRGQGLGRALVRAVKREYRCITLHVDKTNVWARSLYDSEGFIAVQSEEKIDTERVFMKYTSAQQGRLSLDT